MTGGRELVIQSAVSLLATGRAKDADQAVTLALRLVDDVDRALTRRVAASRAARSARSSGEGRAEAAPAKAATKAAPRPSGAKATRPRKAAGSASESGPVATESLPIRPRRLLEKLGVLQQDAETSPRDLVDKLCEAHLTAAKGSSAATVKQIAAWFKAHGAQLPKECATYDANWLTNRCDETPPE